uniref:Wsv189 n=1 Tax=White spot syndrome virus TaxID=92652 RepID=A0A2U9GGP7_WSSV|nr:wsv189 [Shrimp white spot syndrome virus]AWQ60777.1 wsv189 [Shrimp white spot syndrome virus]AWQ61193.1 wsv189 [Shrimp white spot syndrome virus]AWQ61635.1 wsv189 [Shrimp white spot syndrome virus]AWQ62873.1 wsv189 [Shrimp white spot syndrome virus]
MNTLHSNLEVKETPRFWNLRHLTKTCCKIFNYNSVRGCKERQNLENEILLILSEFLPIFRIPFEINIFQCPKTGNLFFVHFPEIFMDNGAGYKTVGVFSCK